MKVSTAIIAVISLLGLAMATDSHDGGKGDKCNRDNCYRDVLGTNAALAPLAARRGDCSKLLGCTKVPAAHVETKTVTYTHGVVTVHVAKITDKPDHIPGPTSSCYKGPPPKYAPCGGKENAFERYSSACSCGGITATTKEGPAPTVYATVKVVRPSIVYGY